VETAGVTGDKCYMVRKNANGTRVTSISATLNTSLSANDTTHTWGVVAGDIVRVACQTGSTDTLADINAAFEISGASTSNPALGVSISPASVSNLDKSTTQVLTATVTNDFGSQGVDWALDAGCGALTGSTLTQTTFNPTSGSACSGGESRTVTATSKANNTVNGQSNITIASGASGMSVVQDKFCVLTSAQTAGSVGTCDFDSNVTSGNEVVVIVNAGTTNYATGVIGASGVTGVGGTFTCRADQGNSAVGNTMQSCYAESVSGGSKTVTANLRAAWSYFGMWIVEVRGAAASNSFDADIPMGYATATSVASGSFNASSNTMAFALAVIQASQTFTAGSGFTLGAVKTGSGALVGRGEYTTTPYATGQTGITAGFSLTSSAQQTAVSGIVIKGQ